MPKVVTGLLASRVDGHWGSIAEDGAILLALRHYFDAFEHDDPDFTAARVASAGASPASESFDGRSTNQDVLTVPTADLLAGGAPNADVIIGHEGSGRLYYRIGLRTAPADLHLDPLDRGFVVARTYEAVDDPADVRRDADGTWHVRAGARVRVRLTMVAESRRDPRRPRRLAARRVRGARTRRWPRRADVPGGDGSGPVELGRSGSGGRGSTTRTCATAAPRRSPTRSTAGPTTGATSPWRRRRARSSPRRRAPRRSTPRRRSAARATDTVVVDA